MTDRRGLESQAWDGWVGAQLSAEFLAESARQGHTTIEAAVAAYVADLPRMWPEEWAAATAAGETDAIPGLLAGYLRRQLLGVAEIAALLDVPRGTVASWHHRRQLPPPTAELAMGPVWALADIEGWLASRLRDRNGRRLEYWRHRTSGEVWVVELAAGEPQAHCGPLDHSVITAEGLTSPAHWLEWEDGAPGPRPEFVVLEPPFSGDEEPREYRAAYVGDVALTGPQHRDLPDAALLDEAMAEAQRQGLGLQREQIRIGTWRERRA